MSTEKPKKAFDTIAYTRKVRAELDAKLAKMTEEEEDEYWRNMRFENPRFQELHERGMGPAPPDDHGQDNPDGKRPAQPGWPRTDH